MRRVITCGMTVVSTRPIPERARLNLTQAGVHPLLARLYAARGVTDSSQTSYSLHALLPPERMKGAGAAADLLASAIAHQEKILIVADYDCDGATACAVGLRTLRAFGGKVDFITPDRFTMGYGLSEEVVKLARERGARVLVTVDNGISSLEGVALAQSYGMQVIVTDHHLPGPELPSADVIVNPNQPGCDFPSKSVAGVGVMFYVMLALRAELRRRKAFDSVQEPNLARLLDLVALGTVADVVALDQNNRILVAQGLRLIRQGKMHPGIAALLSVAGRQAVTVTTFDLGFAIGPRLNAAGRMEDMSLGIDCLVTDDHARAMNMAQALDCINHQRRFTEAHMQQEADAFLERMDTSSSAAIVLQDENWHQGIIGILAGRIKDKCHRPTIIFATCGNGELRGSGRSIKGFHIRDALERVSSLHPGLILRFGGHAAAAGLTLKSSALSRFCSAFEKVAHEWIAPDVLMRCIDTDGELEYGYHNLECAYMLRDEIWGQGFPPPLFAGCFNVNKQQLLKNKHLKLALSQGGAHFNAIRFNYAGEVPATIEAVYRLEANEFRGNAAIQLNIEHF